MAKAQEQNSSNTLELPKIFPKIGGVYVDNSLILYSLIKRSF